MCAFDRGMRRCRWQRARGEPAGQLLRCWPEVETWKRRRGGKVSAEYAVSTDDLLFPLFHFFNFRLYAEASRRSNACSRRSGAEVDCASASRSASTETESN